MILLINGEEVNVPVDLVSIQDLIHHLKLDERIIIVEHNLNILTKQDFSSSVINNRDRIEILQFVGGG